MLSKIDLIIIEGFLTKNMDKFNRFCVDECLGTAGTSKATLNHVKEALNPQPVNAQDAKKRRL